MITGSDGGMEPIDARRVIDHWLALEADKGRVSLEGRDPASLPDADAHAALLSAKPGAASVFHEVPDADWYRIRLREDELRRLRYIGGPEGVLWGALAPERRVLEGADSLLEPGREPTTDRDGVDVAYVRELADGLADGGTIEPPVLSTRRGRAPTRVLDGNHRVTALSLHLRRTGELRPTRAYLGVAPNRVLRPAAERLLGWVGRLLGRRF